MAPLLRMRTPACFESRTLTSSNCTSVVMPWVVMTPKSQDMKAVRFRSSVHPAASLAELLRSQTPTTELCTVLLRNCVDAVPLLLLQAGPARRKPTRSEPAATLPETTLSPNASSKVPGT